jgi:hypothetical protein
MMSEYQKTEAGVLVPSSKVIVKGVYRGKIVRDGKVIDEWVSENLVPTEGLNHILGVELASVTQVTNWYLAPYEANATPSASWTAANFASNSTETTAYTSGTRVAWTPGAASGGVISNSASPATFTFNATKTIYGAGLLSSSTKSGTSGVLFSASLFSSAKNVVNLDQLILTYSFTLTSS